MTPLSWYVLEVPASVKQGPSVSPSFSWHPLNSTFGRILPSPEHYSWSLFDLFLLMTLHFRKQKEVLFSVISCHKNVWVESSTKG